MRNPLAAHPPWRQLLVVSVALPIMISLAVLAFGWPVARTAPRELPVGIVGTGPASEGAVAALSHAKPGGFSFQLYADKAIARDAIEDRVIYGAFAFSHRRVTVLDASAASPAVAQLLDGVGQQLAQHATLQAEASGDDWLRVHVTQVDVVPAPPSDPRELALSLALVPLSISSVMVAAVIALLVGFAGVASGHGVGGGFLYSGTRRLPCRAGLAWRTAP